MKKALLFISLLFLNTIFTGCRNDEISLEEPKDSQNINDSINTEIEEYSTQEQIQLEPVVEIIMIDESHSFTDEDIENYKNEIYSVIDSFSADIFNFQGEEEAYSPRLLAYYADTSKYPRTDYFFSSDVYQKFIDINMRSEYISVNLSDIKINVSDPNNDGSNIISATTKGTITANFSTSEYDFEKYNTVFKSSLVYDNGWKILNVDLCQVFKGDVEMKWHPGHYETVSIEGNYIFNWDIGVQQE